MNKRFWFHGNLREVLTKVVNDWAGATALDHTRHARLWIMIPIFSSQWLEMSPGFTGRTQKPNYRHHNGRLQHPQSLIEAKQFHSNVKVQLTVFFDFSGEVYLEYVPHDKPLPRHFFCSEKFATPSQYPTQIKISSACCLQQKQNRLEMCVASKGNYFEN